MMTCEVCLEQPAEGLTCIDDDPENSIEWLATCLDCTRIYEPKPC